MGRDKNLSESLRYIYEHLGVETFQNEKVVYSILTDLIPKEKMEINWVLDAINSGAIKPLIEAETKNLDREEQKKKAKSILEANEINKSRIDYLLNCFSYGLKWTDKIISIEEIKAQEKKANSKNNTKESVKKTTTKQTDNNNTDTNKKQTVNQQDTYRNKRKNRKRTTTITSDKIQKLEYELDLLHKKTDNVIQFYRNSVSQLKPLNLFASAFVNIFIIIGCILMMASYLFLLKEGYVYKKMLVLGIFGVFCGMRLLKGTFRNLKDLKAKLAKRSTYNKYINLKGAVDFTLKNVSSGSVKNLDDYNVTYALIQDYEKKFDALQVKMKSIPSTIKEENKTIVKWSALFIIIFIISGVFEPRLVYDHNSIYHILSRNAVEFISDKIYDGKFGCVKTDAANIRREANKDSESIRIVEKYEVLNLTGKSYTNDGKVWYEVNLYNEKGWISSSVINVVPKIIIVTEEAANIRDRANINSDVEMTVNKGHTLYTTGKAITKPERVWYEVYIQGEGGYWISSNVVEEVEE